LDFFCVLNGEVIVGECSEPGKFNSSDKDGLVEIAQQLQVSRILYATLTDSLPRNAEKLVEKTKEEVRDSGTQVEALTAADLLPAWLRKHGAKETQDP